MIFVFGDCELDLDRFELRRGGQPRPVEPQVFDLLAVLIRERHRVVPKEELLDIVWGNRFVSEPALTSRVKAARQAIGDDGRNQRLIRTAHGRGYQFVASADEAAQPDPVASVPSAPPEQEQWRSFDELQQRSTSPDNAWRFVDAFANIDVTNLAPKLTVPTLIMCSRREPDNRFEQSRLLAALIPKSRLVPLDSSNHLLPERDPLGGTS